MQRIKMITFFLNKNKILFFVYLIIVAYSNKLLYAHKTTPERLEKIIITSTRALCKKDAKNPGLVIFQYLEDVRVKMFQDSLITADCLDIIFNEKEISKDDETKQNKPSLNSFKQIIFKNNVCVRHKHRKVFADTAHVYPAAQKCILEGNVRIEQTKKSKKDVPVVIKSSKAEIDFAADIVNFLGTPKKPVYTVINLEGQRLVMGKKKKKHDKEKTIGKNENDIKDQSITTIPST